MSKKFSEARRAAFFNALRETGNQTLAAERAKVSRSWVSLHRAQDPEFRRAMETAIAEAKARLFAHPERKPPRGWGHLDGEELVVKGSGGSGGGRRVQIARARLKQWTPRIEERFLSVLAATCNAKAAYIAVGMSRASAYTHRKRWPAFARRWDEAVVEGYARIEGALIEAGCNLFSSTEPAPESPLPPMTVGEAIHLLHMHKNGVVGIGKAPGVRWRPPPQLDEATRTRIMARFAAVARSWRLPEAQKARDRREYARRRRRG